MANRIIRGPSVTVNDRDFNLPVIMDELQIRMDEDPEDASDLSEAMIYHYAGLDEHQRKGYNQAMIDICGFGMRSLLIDALADRDLIEELGFQPDDEIVEDDIDEEDEG